MNINRSHNSCGILEVEGVSQMSNPKTFLCEIYEHMTEKGRKALYITFSDRVDALNKKLHELRDFMKQDFGMLHEIPQGVNPNTENNIGLLIWKYDHELLGNFHSKHFPEYADNHCYEVGDKFIVVANTCGHDREIGDVVVVTERSNPQEFIYASRGSGNWYMVLSDVKKIK